MSDKLNLCFLPGMLCDRRVWRAVWAALPLATRAEVQAHWFDFAGHQFDSIRTMATTVLKAVPTGPLVLAGFSMGGHVAFDITRQAQTRVRAMVLCNTSADTDRGKRRAMRLAYLNQPQPVGRFEGVTRSEWPNVVAPRNVHRDDLLNLVQSMAQTHGFGGGQGHARALLDRVEGYDVLRGLGERQAFALRIIAGEYDQMTSVPQAQAMAKAFGAKHELLKVLATGHLAPLEDPKAVAGQLALVLEAAKQ